MSIFYGPNSRVTLNRVCFTTAHDVLQLSSVMAQRFLIGSLTLQIVVLS
jgi:hypothetical protein